MTATPADCVTVARAELEAARKLLHREIVAYPTPISGCDAQFNHLLSERQRVSNALAVLDTEPFTPTPRQLHPAARVESR